MQACRTDTFAFADTLNIRVTGDPLYSHIFLLIQRKPFLNNNYHKSPFHRGTGWSSQHPVIIRFKILPVRSTRAGGRTKIMVRAHQNPEQSTTCGPTNSSGKNNQLCFSKASLHPSPMSTSPLTRFILPSTCGLALSHAERVPAP